MNREQNIDDILKLLKDSVSTESQTADGEGISHVESPITEELLKAKLKNQYFDNSDLSELVEEDRKEYVLDSDFLEEVSQQQTEETVLPVQENEEIDVAEEIEDDTYVEEETDDELPPDNVDDLIAQLRPVEQEEQYSPLEEDDEETDELFEEIQPHGTIDLSALTEEAVSESALKTEEAPADDDAEWDEFVAEETLSESEVTYEELEILDASQTEDEETADDQAHETFLASMRKVGQDFSDEDREDQSSSEVAEDTVPTSEEQTELIEEPIAEDGEIDLSTISLMMQFCEKDEMKHKLGDRRYEEFIRQQNSSEETTVSSHVFDGNEYVAKDQNQKIAEAYKKKRRSTRNTMLGCLALAIVTLMFELIPVMGVKTSGLLDYTEYPAVYVLGGLQLLAFSAAICYKSLWAGLKRAFSMTPNRYSLVSVVLGLTVLYDLITVIILAASQDDIPNTFNAIAAITVAACTVADYIDIRCEMEAFSVYSYDKTKYTVIKERSPHSVAEKMYAGGLERDKRVYSVASTEFPKGFFGCVSKKKNTGRLLTSAIIAVFIVGIISTVVSIILGADAYASCAAFMASLYGILPVCVIFADLIPFAYATYKLSKRGTAIAGEGMIEEYGDCDVMVFGDLHMFKKCETADVGIAMYDPSVGYLMLGCLDALYSRIGGPLSGMQIEIPAAFRFRDVNIRRIARTGIEAVIDKKHILIVGEHGFMQRYGLAFPDDEVKNGRSTLCVSLNGKVTAKLSVKYRTEPVFEMLVERLHEEGICCAVATYDPLINSAMLSAARTIGNSPVSVVHRNAEDFYADNGETARSEENDGIICCSSRLKLAEAEVWIKKLVKVRKYIGRAMIAFATIGVAAIALMVTFGLTSKMSQFHVLGVLLAELCVICGMTLALLPSKDHFTVDALYGALERQELRNNKITKKKEN